MRKHKNLLIAIAVFIINFSIIAGFFYANEQNYQAEQRTITTTVGNERAYALEKQLDRSLSSTYALASIIRQEGKINNFDALAADMIESYGGISSLQLAPEAVVSQIYPLAGNEAAVGHDLLNDPNRRAETLATIESGELTLAGPFELIQGGIAVIGRYPVFLVEETGESKYWGFTIALIRLEDLLDASGFNSAGQGGYDYEVWRYLPDSNERQVFFQTATVPLSDPSNIDIEVSNGVWVLSIAPQDGWKSSPTFFVGLGLAAFSSLLLSVFVHRILQQPEILHRLIEESENKLKSITTQSSEGITVADADGNYLFVNPAFCEMMGYSEKELLEMTVFDMSAETQISVFERATTSEEGIPIEVVLQRKDGTEFISEVIGKMIEFRGQQSALGTIRDVSKRKRIEEALQESEEKFSIILKNSQPIIFMIDREGIFLLSEGHGLSVLGLEPGQVVGMSAFEMYKDFPPIIKGIKDALNGSLVRDEIDVGGIHFDIFFSPYYDANENVIGLISMAIDITERKSAEKQIRLQSAALESAANAIMITNDKGNIVWANPAFSRVTGYSHEEVLGQNPNILNSGKQDNAFYKNMWDTITAGKVWHGQVINKRKDGDLFTEEMTITPLLSADGKISNFIAIIQDITEEVQAAETLVIQRERLANIIEGTNVGTWDWNIQTGEEIINDRWAEIIGRTIEELAPVTLKTWSDSVHPDDLATANDALEKHVKGELEYYDAEFRQRHKNGHWVWINARGKIVEWSEDGKPLRASGTHLDITERKIAEQNLLLLNKELEQRVLERTAELSATVQEIESFSYSVSHDLRAPLRAISGFSGILMADYAETLDNEIKEYLGKIHEATQNMDDLITGMLFLSRLSRERLSLISFNPGTVVTQVFESLNKKGNERDIIFNAHPCPEIVADPNLIKTLLTNLVSNAIKFTAGKQPASIEFGNIEEKDRVVFYLRDNGIGFNMAYVDKLFTPFQRLHSGDQFKGTGIGLAVAHRVIQRHKGEIWIESEEEVGTTIYFTIGLLIDKQ